MHCLYEEQIGPLLPETWRLLPYPAKKGKKRNVMENNVFTAVFVSQGRKPVSQETMRIRARSFLRFLNNLMEKIWYLANIKKHIKFRSLPF